jgi:hypothetical protein
MFHSGFSEMPCYRRNKVTIRLEFPIAKAVPGERLPFLQAG